MLLSDRTKSSGPAPLVDWRTAPVAELFFSCDEGDEYELEVGERVISGRLLEKNLVEFDDAGELVRIDSPEDALVRRSGDFWELNPAPGRVRIPLRPSEARQPFRSPLDVELDPVQQGVVDLPPDRSVLLLGEAGFGKTTVALLRLLALREQAGPGFRGAVIVPTDGLRRLTELMLERRGISGIEVWTFDRWVSTEGRRVFRGLPARDSVNTPAGVIRLKRSPALRALLAEFVQTQARPGRRNGGPEATRSDLEHLFGDRAWMERVDHAVAPQATEHTRIQFCLTTEQEFAHVRAENLVTVDARRIDEGTPMEDANSLDVEDFAVLFELDRLRATRDGTSPAQVGRFDCVVIDEAQEFAPIELALVGRAVKQGGTVIVAGDAAQQVDPTGCFESWESVMEELQASEAERVVLKQSYRCPPEVTALARAILDSTLAPGDRRAPWPAPSARSRLDARSGDADAGRGVSAARLASRFHQAVWITEEVRRITEEDPSASVALICRSTEAARSWARVLRHGQPFQLALDGEFHFRPGPIVTCISEVKGLEFDYVIIPDATASTYSATADARRALYVAVTRASHRLALCADAAADEQVIGDGWTGPTLDPGERAKRSQSVEHPHHARDALGEDLLLREK